MCIIFYSNIFWVRLIVLGDILRTKIINIVPFFLSTVGTGHNRVLPRHVHIVTDWKDDHTSSDQNTAVTKLPPRECHIDRISPDHSGDSSIHSKDSSLQERAGREEGQDQGRAQWERNGCHPHGEIYHTVNIAVIIKGNYIWGWTTLQKKGSFDDNHDDEDDYEDRWW